MQINKHYFPKKIENYAQKYWKKKKTFQVTINKNKKKFYCLAMLPYPSGNLHMGHVRNYTISDVISRYQRMLGKNVLQPMGWDAFGLPAEIAAIENKISPEKWTKKNIKKMKKQLKSLGFSYDWKREIKTCQPKYFHWEQWFFIQLYKKKLVYKKTSPVNWCENDKTVLANEQVIKGKCWRCNEKITIKIIPQWFIKITNFANKLLKDIKKLKHWPKEVKLMQKNWIGKSKGTEIKFNIYNSKYIIKIFIKKITNLMNTTFIMLSPLHKILKKFSKTNIHILKFIKKNISNKKYQINTNNIGIFINKYAINPINKKKIPIWINNNININNTYNAKIGIPIYNKKDFNFAKKNNLNIIINTKKNIKKNIKKYIYNTKNNNKINLLNNELKIKKKLKILNKGKKKTIFKIKDWSVSRQRFWGTPIPMGKIINTGKIIPLPEKKLPILLNKNNNKKQIIKINQQKVAIENETFDTFIESSWYHIRYTCPNYKNGMIHSKSANYWLPIDQYIGGIEHATMHLIYFRFYHKLLYKLNLIKTSEPAIKLLCQGMVLSDAFYYFNKKNKKKWINQKKITIIKNKKGIITKAYKKNKKKVIYAGLVKMSKSKKNGVSPKNIIKKYGADTIRLFIMFAAPPKANLEWNINGIKGIHKFLKKFWKFIYYHYKTTKNIKNYKKKKNIEQEFKLNIKLQKTIKNVSYFIHKTQKFNNAIAEIISLVNKLIKSKLCNHKNYIFIRNIILNIIKMLHPFIPHFSFYIWKLLTNKKNIDTENWPIINKQIINNLKKNIIIQINGKKKYILIIKKKKTKGKLIKYAIKNNIIKKNLKKKKIKKIIYIKEKLLNFVY